MKNITKKITNNLIYIVVYSANADEFSNMFYDISDAISFAKGQTAEYKEVYIIAIDECLHALLEMMFSEGLHLDEAAQDAGWSQDEINNIKEYITNTFGKTMLEILENGDFYSYDYMDYSEFRIIINDNNFYDINCKYIVYNRENRPIVILDSIDEVYSKLIDKSHDIDILIVGDCDLQDIEVLNNVQYNYYNDEDFIDEYLCCKYSSYENMDSEGNITYSIDYKDIAIGILSFNMF